MNCEEVRRRMLDRALDELPTEEFHLVEEHIRSCAACAQAWEEIHATHALLAHHLVEAEVPRHFRLAATEAPVGWWPRLWVPALRFGLSAGVALVLLVGSLALFGASFTRDSGGFRLAFGRQPAVAPATAISRTAIEQMVDARLRASEQRLVAEQKDQVARLAAELKTAGSSDVRRLGQRLEFLQSAQNQMWKETQRSQYLVELVARSSVPRGSEIPK